MPQSEGQHPVFRFAPSPNGRLHLGHALSAFLNHDMARESGGTYLVRIEDIDQTRCTPALEAGMLADLAWLRLSSDLPERRQTAHLDSYRDALEHLKAIGLVYPAFLTRGEVRAIVEATEREGAPWPRDPDGAPLYPAIDRNRAEADRQTRLAAGHRHQWRLDIGAALAHIGQPVQWQEIGEGGSRTVEADPAIWGDVVLSRSDAPSSYTLSVVIDDAAQGVTHVVRGQDLFEATAVQRLLQMILGLPEPVYRHHRLIVGVDGRKLSKSDHATALAALRQEGAEPSDIRRLVGI